MKTAIGEPLKVYGPSRSLSSVIGLCAALFAGVGIFVLLLPTLLAGSATRFDGDPSLLFGVGAGFTALGLLGVAGVWYFYRTKPRVHLHQEGLVVVAGGHTTQCRFDQLQDLYLFYYLGGFAFRASAATPWTFVRATTSQSAELQREVVARQVAQRGALLYEQLLAGQAVRFAYLPMAAGYLKSLAATSSLDYPEQEMVLTRDSLTVEGRAYPLADIADIKGNSWTETLQIRHVDGSVILTTHFSSVLSLDLLYALLGTLQTGAEYAA
ncbi:hypothetical protein [Hymenobacter lucidus]|uniref:DUF3592 domain-containing protein n=1 Tax=Hymenobacter lucidus TaxID=2880930 RepID=A0ABS8ARD9_9BACT|nr:hypothetical protein [Hymenobacter lucidus]MCB2408775.1 hypothetical protein [Hymenobacter lucidus]